MTEAELLLNFSENLKTKIKQQNIKPGELATRAGLPRRSVWHYLLCEALPTTKNLVKLCNALPCDPGDLYGAPDE